MKTNIAIICLASVMSFFVSSQSHARPMSEEYVQFCNAQAEYAQQAYLSRAEGVTKEEAVAMVKNAKRNKQAESVANDIIDTVYKMTLPKDKAEAQARAIGAGNGMMSICIKTFGGE